MRGMVEQVPRQAAGIVQGLIRLAVGLEDVEDLKADVLRGLAENEVIDVAADQFDRVWARGPGSLTLVSQ